MKLRTWLALLATLALALTLAACGGDEEDEPTGGGTDTEATETQAEGDENLEGRVNMSAIWTGPERKSLEAVIDGFNELYPNVTVKYSSAGDQLPTVLSTAVEGGNPPDVAAVAQPGLVEDLVKRDALKPLDFAEDVMTENFSEDWLNIGTFDDKRYALPFKGANKSTVWYNVAAFEAAGVEPPETWEDFLAGAETLKASGTPAYSLSGADGWSLTDIFENIYLRTAGPDKYDQLSKHEIPWTDESVITALEELQKIFQDTENIAGGTSGALGTDFPTSVTKAFGQDPEGAMVLEGDFVRGEIDNSTKAKAETDYNVFPFPSVNDSPEAVVGGGDMVIAFDDSEATQAFVRYLATPEAAQIWAERGGFSSPNQNLDPSVYPDELTRTTASAVAEAETFRFDMSDLAPADFGGTPGQGEWKILQDFLQNPDDVQGTAEALEKAAKRAF